jgi:predicted PurR-regulated permease PerM
MQQDHDVEANDRKGPWLTRERTLELVLLVITALALYVCFEIGRPFLAPIVWAVALAVALEPMHRRIESRLGRPAIAAGVSVTLVAVLIVGPIALATQQLVREAATAVQAAQDALADGHLADSLARFPPLGRALVWVNANLDLGEQVQAFAGMLATYASAFVASSIWIVVELVIMLFALFFLFRDRELALAKLRALSPLGCFETDRLLVRVRNTIHATLFGTMAVAALQGLLGGLMFWILGLPAPLLWGAVMAMLGLVPTAGAFIVWLPAAGILAAQGDYTRAAVLFAWGATAVSLIDNLLYPFLVGSEGRMHTALVFFAVLGGVIFFGASGVVLGPVSLAFTIGLLDIWHRRLAGLSEGEPPVVALENPAEPPE